MSAGLGRTTSGYRLHADCNIEYGITTAYKDGYDLMAEASVLVVPGVDLTDKSLKAIWAASIGNLLGA
jgi:hypothetical protein